MSGSAYNNTTAQLRQAQMVFRNLKALSTLPEVATSFLACASSNHESTENLITIIKADPALTAYTYAYAKENSITTKNPPSIEDLVAAIPPTALKNIILSIETKTSANDESNILSKHKLQLHSIATACAAEDIANLILDKDQQKLAFTAGLLVNIGKMAIEQTMPKSFERIVEYARDEHCSLAEAEQKHLSINHTLIAKRLAEKWQFPKSIIYAIWLHNSHTDVFSNTLPNAKLIQVIAIANSIARESQIGHSGDFDIPTDYIEIAKALNLNPEKLQQIKEWLPNRVESVAKSIGLNTSTKDNYSDSVRNRAYQLAQNCDSLKQNNEKLKAAKANLSLIENFMHQIHTQSSAIESATVFAKLLKETYNLLAVSIYLTDSHHSDLLEAVLIKPDQSQLDLLISKPEYESEIPKQIQSEFKVTNIDGLIEWATKQIPFAFKKNNTFIAPLRGNSQTIGVIIFECNQDNNNPVNCPDFMAAALAAGSSIALASAHHEQQYIAEQFANLLARLRSTQDELATNKSFMGLSETAFGAAHELNNPLSIISGRSQLLISTEEDPDKKKMLEQIYGRSEEISQIVMDLMNFARPQNPNPRRINVLEMIHNCIKTFTEDEINEEIFDINTDNHENTIYADYQQCMDIIEHIISNAHESYNNEDGQVKITVANDPNTDFINISISDKGCGMTHEVLTKCTQPFYSHKKAGRQRGMGLSHVKRLVELNNGKISINSEQDNGTTVKISLPISQ